MAIVYRQLVSTLVAFISLAVVGDGVAAQQLDLPAEVQAVFKQHCFECHAGENLDGSLSLESIAGIQNGGHSGSPLVAENLEDSEIYLRVVSDSDGYRMPKYGSRLSNEEIAVLSDWIPVATKALASQTPDAKLANEHRRRGSNSSAVIDDSFFASREIRTLLTGGLGLLVVGLYLLFRIVRILRSRRRENLEIATVKPSWFRWLQRVMLLAMFSLLTAWSVYAYLRIRSLESINSQLTETLGPPPLVDDKAPIIIDKDNLPLPPHPMHPKRLGGSYFRGNDERNESLFNGGFYRTATIELHLVDTDLNRLKWGDALEGEVSIELSVLRANEATKELFSPRTRELCSVEHYCETKPDANSKLKFETIEEFNHWRTIVPLPPKSEWVDGKASGVIYLMYGKQVASDRPRPHFAARYNLAVDGETISDASELWMGNMFTLGGRVLVPRKDEVLLDRWFDWRPIPEIEGKGATDPDLLGLPEHQK